MTHQVKSNVSTVASAIPPEDQYGVPQLVWYQGGVGTGVGFWNRLTGAATGAEIKKNVRAAYEFIVINWIPGAEIYLFGWSRGAYTARVVSGMIADVGLLTRTGLQHFDQAFDAYYHPNMVAKDVVPAQQRRKVLVDCVAVWETVGNLGIPNSDVLGWRLPFLNRLIEWWNKLRYYDFKDTALPSTSKIGLQAYSPDFR